MPARSKTHNPMPKWMRSQVAQAKGREERASDAYHWMYQMPEWRDRSVGLRWHRLAIEPNCRECSKARIASAATDVDHIVPHRGDMRLFLDVDNTQSLCHRHHSIKTARERSR